MESSSKVEQVPGLKQALENVTRALAESTAATNRSTEVSTRVEQAATRLEGHYVELRDEVAAIRARIDGSKPPPAGGASLVKIIDAFGDRAKAADEKATKATASTSVHDLEVPAIQAELLAIRGELRKQSQVMGIGKKGLRWLLSTRGLKTAVSLATLAGALYAAFEAAAHAHQPPPATVILPAPPGSR